MRYITLGLIIGLTIGCTESSSVDKMSSRLEPVQPATAPSDATQAPTASTSEQPAGDAQELLSAALEAAKEQNKRLLVHLGAPWCGWCKVLEEFLQTNAALFADDYIDLKIDIEQMKNGAEVAKKLRGDRTGGIPWIVILDSSGTELISSDGPNGNIGCPMAEDEQAYFVSMLEKTRQHAQPDRISQIAKQLAEFAQKKKG